MNAPASGRAKPQTDSPAARQTGGPCSRCRSLGSGALVIAIALALLELFLRILGAGNPVLYERNREVGYRLKPNQHARVLRNTISINSFGVRDPRGLTDRTPGKKRVVCLGDSVTWGGIYERQESLFTSVAENKLRDTEVVNAGVNGYSTTQMARLYENYLTGLNPDLVIFCIIDRDIQRPAVVDLAPSNVAFPEHAPRLAIVEALEVCRVTVASYFGLDWLRPAGGIIVRNEFNGHSPERINLDSIISVARKFGAATKTRFMVVSIPVESGRLQVQNRQRHLLALHGGGIATVDLGRRVSLSRLDFVDNVHLNTAGHRKVGAALAAVIDDALSGVEGDFSVEPPDDRRNRR